MDSRGESSRGATPTLLNGSTPPALPPQRTSSATNKRPAVLDLTEQTLGNPTATRGQVERPNSPGQDSSEDLPVIQGQRKRVRTSEEGYRPSTGRKRASATQGSPLNPQNNRIASLSPSMAHRRRAAMENAFEHNPMYEEGMEIFQDPLTAKSAMETRIQELQRRTREIGPAPLPPKSPPQTPPTALRSLTPISSPSPNPKTPQSTGVRQSLDANVASIQRRGYNSLDTRRSPTPGGLGSPVAPHVRSMSPLVPRDVQASSPEPLRRVETVPTGPSVSPSKETKAHGRTSIGHLISEMARRGKGKEKEVDAEDILHFNQSVASIRASSLANDPAVLQRVSTVADQLGRRYGLVYRALKAGEPPPNPLAVIRWRKRLLGNVTSTTRPSRAHPHVRKHFDLPPIIDEELSAESMGHHLYSQEEIDSLAWVRSLNTLHLQEVASEVGSKPGLPEVMDWHLTAGVVEGYVIAAKREREEEARRQFGVLRESPASSDTSFFHGRESVEHHPTTRIVDPRYGAALSPKSSSSASSQARNPSGHSSFRFPFSSPKAAADALSMSSSSQKSADMRQTSQPYSGAEDIQSPRSDGTAIVVNTPDPRKVTPSSIDTSAAAGSLAGVSRRSSLDFGFTSDEPAAGGKSGRRRIRNSLPGIIDSSRNSLSQFLSPITGASSGGFTRSPIARMHTSPHFNPSQLTSKDPETEKGGNGHLEAPHSDDGESGRSSLSDNVRSPIVSASDDGRHSFTALEKMKQRMMGRTAGQPALSELVENERDNLDASRTSSVAQLLRPRVVSPDGVEISSSEDDFSLKRNLANTRAGRKMAQSWNALTKRDQKPNLYDERDEHLGATGSGDTAGARRKALFRLDTDATERPGTRSDHLLRTGKRRSLAKMRPVTQEEEEIRLAKKRQLESKERTAYEQRLSLVLESRRQSEAVNHILQIALRAVSDYTTRQAALLDSLGVTVHPHISASIFDTLEPIRSSDQPGWRGIEEDLNESYRRHALLDNYLASLETESLTHSQPEETFLQDIMDVIPAIVGQINIVEAEGQRLEEEMGHVEELQTELQQAIDKEEAKVIATVEMIEAGYPELAKNDALANKLKLDNATQLFPSEWPSWLKDALYIASPFVDWLANVILLIYSSWKTKVPYPMRNMAWMTFYLGFNGLQAGFAALVLLYHSQYRTPVLMATFFLVLSVVFRNVLYLFFGAAFTSSSTVQVSSTS